MTVSMYRDIHNL